MKIEKCMLGKTKIYDALLQRFIFIYGKLKQRCKIICDPYT